MATSVDISIEPSYLSDGSYTGQNDRQWFDDIMRDGILAGTDFVVTAGTTNTLSISAGQAYVLGQNVAAQGMYRVREPNANNNAITITNGDVSKPRIDQLVLMVKDASHDTSGLRKGMLKIIDGVATTGATLNNRTGVADLTTLPDNTKSVLLLTDILVPAGATTSAACTIRDRRKLSWPKNTLYATKVSPLNYFVQGTNVETDLVPTQNIPGYFTRSAWYSATNPRMFEIAVLAELENSSGASRTALWTIYVGNTVASMAPMWSDTSIAIPATAAGISRVLRFDLTFLLGPSQGGSGIGLQFLHGNVSLSGQPAINNVAWPYASGDIGAAALLNNAISGVGTGGNAWMVPAVTATVEDINWKITSTHSSNLTSFVENVLAITTKIY